MLKRLFLTGADTQNAGLMTSAMVTQLNQLRQAVFGSGGSTAQSRSFYGLGIEINKGNGALHLRGAEELIAKGYTPYLFRYTRKRNRVNISGEKSHGPVRKGWNVLGKADTVTIGNDETVLIDAKVIHRGYEDDQRYRYEARYFVKEGRHRLLVGQARQPQTVGQDQPGHADYPVPRQHTDQQRQLRLDL